MQFYKYIAYSTYKIVYKFHVSIYKRDNAINIKVQPKVLLNDFSASNWPAYLANFMYRWSAL